jgi:hypothetical protein
MIHLSVFFTACLLLAITPGPGLMYVIARTSEMEGKTGFGPQREPFLEGFSMYSLRAWVYLLCSLHLRPHFPSSSTLAPAIP